MLLSMWQSMMMRAEAMLMKIRMNILESVSDAARLAELQVDFRSMLYIRIEP